MGTPICIHRRFDGLDLWYALVLRHIFQYFLQTAQTTKEVIHDLLYYRGVDQHRDVRCFSFRNAKMA